ncbi:MAG: DUF4345 family protein [Pseudomonadales bacterium]
MLPARLFLAFTGIMLLPYGLVCFYDPALPASYFGVSLGESGGPVEFMAMYGGLQAAIGLYCLRGAISKSYTLESVRVAVFIFAGLGFARLAGLIHVGLDDYNLWASCYELGSFVLAFITHRRAKSVYFSDKL